MSLQFHHLLMPIQGALSETGKAQVVVYKTFGNNCVCNAFNNLILKENLLDISDIPKLHKYLCSLAKKEKRKIKASPKPPRHTET
jgi:hypothetical protein